MDKKIILIAGGTASGKTVIAKILQENLLESGLSSTLMGLDNYYRSIDELPEEKGEDVNWDSPKVIDWEQFRKDLVSLKEGKDVLKGVYNFSKYTHEGEVEYKSADYIIIEGLFTLYKKDIRELSSSMIYIDADDDIRLMRRIDRDGNGRYKETFNTTDFMKKWSEEIKPMHKKYIYPTSEYADFIIRNNKPFVEEEKERMIKLLHSIVVK